MIEIGAVPPPTPPDQAAAIRQLLFEAIRRGEGGAPLLRAMLGDVRLPPDQQALVDFLLSSAEDASSEAATADVTEDDDETTGMQRELADLRQANDTVAAALGACPYCWGGDIECPVCRGQGRPGFAPPDAGLFEELVVPAIQRRARQRTGFPRGSRRERV